ncbi:hypothetical protein RIF29_15862 [Crotalaria pallida]|uniref:Uncharacterized protein n=1 Tax=Crotalaria pallida TaxID=3830 RepID=A0AAN9IDY3_CROPI
MARKRGRPPKTPSTSSSKKPPSAEKRSEEGPESNVTQKWVEKKKPSREDIEKIDDCMRSNDEQAVETAINQANGENTQQSSSFVEESINPGSSAVPKGGSSAKVQDKGKGILVESEHVDSDSENAEPWVPVVTRSKIQQRKGENKGIVIKDLASKANG